MSINENIINEVGSNYAYPPNQDVANEIDGRSLEFTSKSLTF